jgi:MFS superfamily sulfate permease-like transporter
MTLYRLLADGLLVLHFAYAGFVVLALPVILIGVARGWQWVRNFWFRVVHFLMIAVVVAESLVGVFCPLTRWENQLRAAAGQEGYAGAFITAWVGRLLYYDFPEWVLTTCYCLFGGAVLLTLILAPPRRPWGKTHVG